MLINYAKWIPCVHVLFPIACKNEMIDSAATHAHLLLLLTVLVAPFTVQLPNTTCRCHITAVVHLIARSAMKKTLINAPFAKLRFICIKALAFNPVQPIHTSLVWNASTAIHIVQHVMKLLSVLPAWSKHILCHFASVQAALFCIILNVYRSVLIFMWNQIKFAREYVTLENILIINQALLILLRSHALRSPPSQMITASRISSNSQTQYLSHLAKMTSHRFL